MRLFLVLLFISNNLWNHSSFAINSSSTSVTDKRPKKAINKSSNARVGKVIDRLNGVEIYYNGSVRNTNGRNTTADGYNLGLKYQCIEFVKRYYYEYYRHKMPNSYGHAKEFFDKGLTKPAAYNSERGLMQYWNGANEKPRIGDILVFKETPNNPFGHIGIISKVSNGVVEMVQQNVGEHTRNRYKLKIINNNYQIVEKYLLGWLRKT